MFSSSAISAIDFLCDFDERGTLEDHFADLDGRDLAAVKFGAQRGRVFLCYGNKQSAGSLRIEKEGAKIVADVSGELDA